MRASLLVTSVFATVVLTAPAARAGDPAAAQALFADAKQLTAQGRWADACPKFDESQRLDPGIGTLFHVADCDEHLGKTASAWAAFLDVAAQAKAAGQPARERVARDRAAAIEPGLARMTTIVTGPVYSLKGLEVRRDGVAVGRGQWGAPMPVDPGEHVILASAPGKRTWEKRVKIDARGNSTVQIPMLEEADHNAVAAAPSSASPNYVLTDTSKSSDGAARRGVGIGVGALGLVGLGVGTYFGLASKSKRDDSAAHCTGNVCDATGVGLRSDAMRDGNVATVAIGVGAAAVIGGAVLILTAPRHHEEGAAQRVRPTIAVSPAGIDLRGAF